MPKIETHTHLPESTTNIIAIAFGIFLLLIAWYIPQIGWGFQLLFGIIGVILIFFGILKFIFR
jgi:hypothetical protein